MKIILILILATATYLVAQESTNNVKTILIDRSCSICKVGKMRPGNSVLTSNPPQYPHSCNNCKTNTAVYLKVYPYISYE